MTPGRLDRLKGLLPRVGADPALVAGADGSGVAWTSVGLKVARPGRPHRLSVTVAGGHPSALGVGLVSWHAPTAGVEGRARLLLDACASAGPIAEGAEPVTFSRPVWPDAIDPVLVLFNTRRGPRPPRGDRVDRTGRAGRALPCPPTARRIRPARSAWTSPALVISTDSAPTTRS
ncbi:MAG: hypothetical protein U0800_01070 [Isosphaeraceae bacterium]